MQSKARKVRLKRFGVVVVGLLIDTAVVLVSRNVKVKKNKHTCIRVSVLSWVLGSLPLRCSAEAVLE